METKKINMSDIESQLLQKVSKDPKFRKRYLKNPKATIEEEWGVKLPQDLEIFVHENTGNEVHFTLPKQKG